MPTIKIATTTKSLKDIAEKAAAASGTFRTFLQSQGKIAAAQKVKMIDSQIEHMDGPTRKKFQPQYESAFSSWAKNHVKETEKARFQTLRELIATQEGLTYAKANMGSARRLASSFGIGSDELSKYQNQIANAGGAVRAALAAKAKADGDKLLAAALIAKQDSLPRADRTFDSDDLAESVFGKEASTNRELLVEAEKAINQAIRANREFESKPTTPLMMIEDGLKYGANGLKDEPAPLKKESDGLADGLAMLKELSDASDRMQAEQVARAAALKAELDELDAA